MPMNETKAIIERVKKVNRKVQHLELAVDKSLTSIKPGQSLLARLDEDSWHPYLREQWWPVSLSTKKLFIERPVELQYQPGQVVNILGLVGKPYRFRRTLRNVLLIAYETSPTALLMIIPWLLGNQVSVTLVLAGSATEYSTGHINAEVEIVHGDEEMDWPDQVMTIGWADQVFVVVKQDDEMGRFRKVMERFQQRRADIPSNYLFGVFQPTMTCGAGACSACMLQMKEGAHLICTDGPAFDLTQVAKL
jgi:hypothetical protein